VAHFQAAWESVKAQNLRYAVRETWEKLNEKGTLLLERFVAEEYPKIGTVHASEKSFTLTISTLDLPFVGVVDLVADVEGKRTVIDFKTSSSTYEDYEVALSDQLTAYQLAEPGCGPVCAHRLGQDQGTPYRLVSVQAHGRAASGVPGEARPRGPTDPRASLLQTSSPALLLL